MNKEELYQKVVALHEQGYGSRRIAKMLGVDRKSFEHWIYPVRGKLCKPRLEPDLNPSPELAYVLGVLLSDGFLYYASRKYSIILRAKDKDFVAEFRRCLLKVSKRKVCFFRCKDGLWHASCACKKLYMFLDNKLKHFETINDNLDCFIRGFADGDGCAYISNRKYGYVTVQLDNTNLSLLRFIQKLLKDSFEIHSRIYVTTGSEKTKKTPWRLRIDRQASVVAFARYIGFATRRKNRVAKKVRPPIVKRMRSV